jgi:hypothetical protein
VGLIEVVEDEGADDGAGPEPAPPDGLDALTLQRRLNGADAIAAGRLGEDTPHHLRTLLVHDEVSPVGVVAVAERGRGRADDVPAATAAPPEL